MGAALFGRLAAIVVLLWAPPSTAVTAPAADRFLRIRETWLANVMDTLQAAVGSVLRVDRLYACDFLIALVNSLPAPHGTVESLLLKSLLIEFAGDCGTTLHEHVHRRTARKKCGFVPASFLEYFWKPRSAKPRDAFEAWATVFFKQLGQVHPLSPATTAAELLRTDPRHGDIPALAHRVHTPTIRLLREFQREYGMSIRTYRRYVMVAVALDRVGSEKIEALALDLGYRSPKNFFQAFKQVTGVTPASFRDLPPHESRRILDSVRVTLGTPRLPRLARSTN